MPDEKYLYLAVRGESTDQTYLYYCQLMVEIGSDLIELLIEGEEKEFGNHFVFVASVPCEASKTSDGYFLKINKTNK